MIKDYITSFERLTDKKRIKINKLLENMFWTLIIFGLVCNIILELTNGDVSYVY